MAPTTQYHLKGSGDAATCPLAHPGPERNLTAAFGVSWSMRLILKSKCCSAGNRCHCQPILDARVSLQMKFLDQETKLLNKKQAHYLPPSTCATGHGCSSPQRLHCLPHCMQLESVFHSLRHLRQQYWDMIQRLKRR